MDLRRLKTVFIFILLAANIFMGVILHNAEVFETNERLAMSENVSDIMSKHMIYLHEELVLPETPVTKNYYLEKMFGSTEEMIENFLGEGYTETADGMFESKLGSLFVNGDDFVYRKTSSNGSIDKFSEENVEALCREEMKRLGIMDEIYSFSGFNQIPDGVKAIFSVRHTDSEFFDAYVSFDVSQKGVTAIGGKNIISDLEVLENSAEFTGVESILLGLIKSENTVENVAKTVISVKPGYYIGKSEESYRNILAIPVWQVAMDSGQIFHFDARNGQKIEE